MRGHVHRIPRTEMSYSRVEYPRTTRTQRQRSGRGGSTYTPQPVNRHYSEELEEGPTGEPGEPWEPPGAQATQRQVQRYIQVHSQSDCWNQVT